MGMLRSALDDRIKASVLAAKGGAVQRHHWLAQPGTEVSGCVHRNFNSSERRLARLLLLLANCGKEGDEPIAPVVLSQDTLAEMIGTTRYRINMFMNMFRRLGYISITTGRSM